MEGSEPAVSVARLIDEDGISEGISDETRVVAQRKYAKRIGVPFGEVSCTRAYIRIRTRDEFWKGIYGRSKAIEEACHARGWEYDYVYNTDPFTLNTSLAVGFMGERVWVDEYGHPIPRARIDQLVPRDMPSDWFLSEAALEEGGPLWWFVDRDAAWSTPVWVCRCI